MNWISKNKQFQFWNIKSILILIFLSSFLQLQEKYFLIVDISNKIVIPDVDSVCEIFSLKSEQEEVSDFSFSFGQTDLCEGLIAWMSHDTDHRKQYIHTLRQYVCLHQVRTEKFFWDGKL